MTGEQHYLKAMGYIEPNGDHQVTDQEIAKAQVHAILLLASEVFELKELLSRQAGETGR